MAMATVQLAIAASPWFNRLRLLLLRRQKIRCIEVIFAGNPDKGEQGIAPRVGESGSHPSRGGRVGDSADRPIRGDPLSRRMGQYGRQVDGAGSLIDGSRLHGCDFVLAQGLANNVEAAR